MYVGKDYTFPSSVPVYSETHGAQDVAIFARGPMSHLFHGLHEQNYIAHVMMYASCLGKDTRKRCDDDDLFSSGSGTTGQNIVSMVTFVTIAISFRLLSYD